MTTVDSPPAAASQVQMVQTESCPYAPGTRDYWAWMDQHPECWPEVVHQAPDAYRNAVPLDPEDEESYIDSY
jgi:hypothetical protein